MPGPRLSLVLPAYNEEAGLRQAIVEADEALSGLCGDYEILVVDDGSSDATRAIAADEATRRPNVRLLRHETNRGYGAALRTGFEAARHDLVAFTDADCQFHLDDLALLLPHTETSPVVVGYRIDRKDPWRRRFLSRGYNLLARTLLGTVVRDVDCALKVFRRDALAKILPVSRGFFVNTEMLTRARQQGLNVVEVGVRHRPRLRGQSTVTLRDVPRTLAHLLPFWWGQATFAGERKPEGGWAALLGSFLVLAVACLLFFSSLRAPLLEPQEARYAEIPRQMLAQGRWLVPLLHGQDYLDKPPLFYWAVMLAYRAFGPHDWAARLVPGLAGVGCVLITRLWGRRMFGPRGGVCAAAVLCVLPEFVYRCRMLTFDGLLALWTTAALACAWRAVEGRSLRLSWWLLSAAACGLGLLTKGPVALALVAVPLAALLFLDGRRARIGWKGWAGYLSVAILVAAPWYAAVMAARPEFAGYFFWRHNVVRFVAPFDHAKPMWFYLPQLLVGLAPWVVLVPLLVLHLMRRPLRAAARRPAGLGFALLAFGWMLLFFSLAGSKRPVYLIPALPPLALALGWLVARYAPRLTRGSVPAEWVALGGLGCGAALALFGMVSGVVRPDVGLWLIGAALAGMALIYARPRLAWAGSFGLLVAAVYLGVVHLLPAYNDQFSVRGALRRQARAGQEVVCYPMRYDSASFYLPRNPVRVFTKDQSGELIAHLKATPGVLLLVKSGPTLRRLLEELPPTLRFVGKRDGAIAVGRIEPRPEGLTAR
jgi:4-amino-4-deoxy-L-arabinose transferase-like glycosyltransferase